MNIGAFDPVADSDLVVIRDAYALALASLNETHAVDETVEWKLAKVLFHTFVSQAAERGTGRLDTRNLAFRSVEHVLALYASGSPKIASS